MPKHVSYYGSVSRCWRGDRLVQCHGHLGLKLVGVIEGVVIGDDDGAVESRGSKGGENRLHVSLCGGKYLRQTILDARRVVIALFLQQKHVVRSEVNRHQLRAAVLLQETCGESKLRGPDRAVNNVQGKQSAITTASVIGSGRRDKAAGRF